MRRVFPWIVAECAVLGSIAYGAMNYLSFGHIINNAVIRAKYYSLAHFGEFVVSAFLNADVLTLTMAAGAVFVGALMLRDAVRTYRSMLVGNFARPARVI